MAAQGHDETRQEPGSPPDPTRIDPSFSEPTVADVQYARPVDPWAEAEAAAVAAGGHLPYQVSGPSAGTPAPGVGDPAGKTGGRSRRAYRIGLWSTAGAAAVALGVTAAVVLWPSSSIDFHRLGEPSVFTPGIALTSAFSDATVIGDRAYYVSAAANGVAAVTAVDTASGEELWHGNTTLSAARWDRLVATEAGPLLVAGIGSGSTETRMELLDESGGASVWHRDGLAAADSIHLGTGVVFVVADGGKLLYSLDSGTGGTVQVTRNTIGSTIVVPTTPADLTGPADATGTAINPALADDNPFVQVTSRGAVMVRDMRELGTTAERDEIAATGSGMVAHDGRLFVPESGSSRRIWSYDLAKINTAEPVALYTSQQSGADLGKLTPCGELLCFVETPGYDRKKAEVVALDVTGLGEKWRLPVPDVTSLVPVGDAVAAVTTTTTTLIGADGKAVWSDQPGVTVRLNDGNLLRFSDDLTTGYAEDRSVAGVPLGGEPVELGQALGVRPDTCSWNTYALACVGKENFVLYRFSE
ncbi:hypothetical protein [Actinoplanes rectilineatus]|uniref:hypothetical protein n=1 Tax=Actinoplanes rectilineatus TaxID=113571 RepID=UPI0005F28D77|nr:hypothetical protein [Actinoplanes rectilineatus]